MIQDNTRASLNLLLNISRELVSLSNLRTMLARVLSLSVEAVGAERGSLIVVDADRRPVDAAIIYQGQLLPHTVEQLRVTLDRGLAGWVFRNNQPVLIRDTSQDGRWLRLPDDASDRSGSKSALCVLLSARDRTVGVLTLVHPTPEFFNEEQLALLQAIADLAGIAVFNAQLYDSLNTARQRYYDLFEDSVDPIYITDRSGKILEANRQAEQACGYSIGELQGRSIFDFHTRQVSVEHMQREKTEFYESKLQPRGKDAIPVEVHVRRIGAEDRDYFQWIIRDISARKRLEALQDDLASMIYHDLRSPLSNVFSSLEMIEVFLPESSHATLMPVVKIATRSAERVQRLINSLLDIRRLEAGQPITARRMVEVDHMLEEIYEFMLGLIEPKEQRMILEVDTNLPEIFIDGDMIRRVLINLLENASKFTPNGGLLAAGARLESDHTVLFWVRDTGKGIPAEIREKIFDKFISLQSESMPRGLGLGLAFCRLAVEAHGGKIWVESQAGQGSTFYFTLATRPPD